MPLPTLPTIPWVPVQKPVAPSRVQVADPGWQAGMPPLPDRPAAAATQRQMPALPARPAGAAPQRQMPPLPTPWAAARGPSAKHVQKVYVDTRLKELEAVSAPMVAKTLLIIEQVLLRRIPEKKRPRSIKAIELKRVYQQIQTSLQSAQLTVNFGAYAWFAKANPYDTYTQMYQRAVERRGGEDVMVLKDTPQNQADTRAGVDNNVTFPKNWTRNKTVRIAERGQSLGTHLHSPARVQAQMDTGKLNDVRADPKGLAEWTARNKSFNPDTKQIFLALNYGRRPHGSAVNYGHSYFIAKDDLKARCLYYSRDTFHSGTVLDPNNPAVPLMNQNIDASLQVPFGTLGTILAADASLQNVSSERLAEVLNNDVDRDEAWRIREAIFEACYDGKALKDITVSSANADYLLEAHHFGTLQFSKDVECMVISPTGIKWPPKVDPTEGWRAIIANAKEFTKRNNIRLYQTD